MRYAQSATWNFVMSSKRCSSSARKQARTVDSCLFMIDRSLLGETELRGGEPDAIPMRAPRDDLAVAHAHVVARVPGDGLVRRGQRALRRDHRSGVARGDLELDERVIAALDDGLDARRELRERVAVALQERAQRVLAAERGAGSGELQVGR